MYPKVPP